MEKQIKYLAKADFDAEKTASMTKTVKELVYNCLINLASTQQMIKHSLNKYNQTLFKKQKKSNFYIKL